MDLQPSKRVSTQLQRISHELERNLEHAADGPVAFIVLLQTSDGIVQYVNNIDRADAELLLTTQLKHWLDGRADIPAHYNPDLKPSDDVLVTTTHASPRIGIAIDSWKLPIFEKHLKAAGYVYEQRPGVMPDGILLTVKYDRATEAAALHRVVADANKEARARGPR